MKAAPLRLPKVGNVYIKNLSASFPLTPAFFPFVPARQPIFIAFDCLFRVFWI